MIKISASFTKKVPGDEPYSSDGVHLGVEIEVPDKVLADEDQFSQAVRRLFAQARTEVEAQVSRPRITEHSPDASNGNGRHHTNGNGGQASNGRTPQPASARQLDFLLSLGRRNANLSPNQIMDEAGVEKLTDITKGQASTLIDRFSEARR